ncbi:MAG: hypothetical protein EBR59_07585 [Methylococcaceae bacterium]|jgi:hypothetical protein|nr:hypothetical protein [Methylococcaceae bacterium]
MENDAQKIIAALGGQSQLARLLGLHRCTVYQWSKRGIPKPWRLYLEKTYPELFRNQSVVMIFVLLMHASA